MRLLCRHTLNALTVLSLLLCVATVALWARSYWVSESVSRESEGWPSADVWEKRGVSAELAGGGLCLRFERVVALVSLLSNPPTTRDASGGGAAYEYHRERSTAYPYVSDPAYRGAARWGFAGYRFAERDAVMDFSVLVVILPMWFATALAAALPAARGWHRRAAARRRTRAARGRCPRCGYDLTGNESGVCPECGTKVG